MNKIGLILGLGVALLSAGAASAETSPCGGQASATPAEIHGPVLHVIDGRTLCVAEGVDPSQWVAVRLEDAPPSASWGALMSVAFGKDVTCVLRGAAAICRIEGRSIGAQLDGAATRAGVAWRRPAAEPARLDAPMRMAVSGS